MLVTKTHHFGKDRNLVSVYSDKYRYNDGTPKLLGFIEKRYFPNDGSYKVILSTASGLKFGRFPRVVRVSSIKNGLRVLIKAELKIKGE